MLALCWSSKCFKIIIQAIQGWNVLQFFLFCSELVSVYVRACACWGHWEVSRWQQSSSYFLAWLNLSSGHWCAAVHIGTQSCSDGSHRLSSIHEAAPRGQLGASRADSHWRSADGMFLLRLNQPWVHISANCQQIVIYDMLSLSSSMCSFDNSDILGPFKVEESLK